MNGSDLLAAIEPVLAVLEQLGVRHFVGGSVASSAHGVARASLDVDMVAELQPGHVTPFVADGGVRVAREPLPFEEPPTDDLGHLRVG